MLGSTVGKYRIVGHLGKGATGIVYRAVDDTLGREVALKILNPALTDPEILKRFRSEATVLARLNHPGIATIYDLFQSETELIMVMELVRGETLERLSDRLGPLPPDRAVYLVDGILAALEHAHRGGVVHRDMKPANVMVTESGRIKVMDFGVARARGAEHITLDGYLVGTPAYMAPEQVLGQKIDERADLYSVGVMFYRLLTRALPFTADTAMGMLQQQISVSPAPIRLHREGLPEWCETIVQRALAKSPDDRFQSAGSFREALARANGVAVTADPDDRFPAPEGDALANPVSPPNRTLIMSVTEGELSAEASAADQVLPGSQAAASAYVHAMLPVKAESFAIAVMKVPQRKPGVRAASLLVAFAAGVAVLAYVPLETGAPAEAIVEPPPAATAPAKAPPVKAPSVKPRPTLAFNTKAVVGAGRKQREREARLMLSERRLTVTDDGDERAPLHSVAYDDVISISYSRGRDPMWNSPNGPARVTQAKGSGLSLFGISVQRHWVVVRTNTEARFVVLSFDDGRIKRVLTALEERTGRKPHLVGKQARS